MAVFAALACASSAVAENKSSLPHVLWVLADDLGYGNVNWLREENNISTPEVQTPVLDSLVKDGIKLSRFYVFKCW